MRYLRPELYSCRTPRDILVEHLGWYAYNKRELISTKSINSKVLCFALVGGSVKNSILDLASKRYALFYRLCSGWFMKVWILRRYFFLLKYILVKGRKKFDGHGV